jgi:hypothetical protein
LYFASQGAGRLGWPLVGALLRVSVAIGAGLLALQAGLGTDGIFMALAAAMVSFSAVMTASTALGAWFTGRPVQPAPAALPEPGIAR